MNQTTKEKIAPTLALSRYNHEPQKDMRCLEKSY